MIRVFLICCTWVFAFQNDHILLTRVVTQPDKAESISIYNPTTESIDLTYYYICDDEDYYKMQCNWDIENNECRTESDMSPSHSVLGFTAQFPPIFIAAGEILHIVLNENYSEFYNESFSPDLIMYGSDDNSMLGTENGSFGTANGKINESSELIILFKWDGDPNHLVEDVDYFLWGLSHPRVNKTEISDYLEDSNPENQYFDVVAQENYAYSRIDSGEEISETPTGGNGIFGHDETSEIFRESWEIVELFNLGCTDEAASNYDPQAAIDDESCEYLTTLYNIIHNCSDDMGDALECAGEYDLSATSAGACPLYEESVTTSVIIVDYFDITPYNGPHSFTIQDNDDNQIDFVVWPQSSSYQDGFDITQSSFNILTQPPYGTYEVKITGELGAYCDDDEILDINSEWQVTVEYESDIIIIEHEIVTSEQLVFEVAPYPFIPSRGEKISYTYSVPTNFRCIIRIFDISGRFITTLYEGVPIFFDTSEKTDTWNGRNQLGQLSTPGVYLIHLEATEVSSGASYEKIAPIVIGVPLK